MEKLLNKRNTIEANFRRVVTRLATDLRQGDTRIPGIYNQVEKDYEKLAKLHDEILDTAYDSDVDISVYETKFLELTALKEDIIGDLDAKRMVPDNRQPTILNSANSEHGSSAYSDSDIHFPRLQLPTFSGDILQWSSFASLFKASVDGNSRLSEVHKLQYLKGALKGEAAQLLNHIPIETGFYEKAWSLLLERYDNKRQGINSHIRRMLEHPQVQHQDGKALQRFIDVMNEGIRALDVLERPEEHFNSVMSFVLLSKLDKTSKLAWEMTLEKGTIPPIEKMLQFLTNRASVITENSSDETKGPRETDTSTPDSKTRKSSCHFCSSTHPPYKCDVFLKASVEEKVHLVQRHRLCFNCLSSFHNSKKCTSRGCKECGGRHHSLLHKPAVEKLSPPQTTLATGTIQARRNPALLATALVKVDDHAEKSHISRALVDFGSNASAMTQRAFEHLRPSFYREENIIKGIGDIDGGKADKVATVKLSSLIDGTFSEKAQFIVVKTISLPKPDEKLPHDKWSHLKGLQLADPQFHTPGEVDFLIGADLYDEIVKEGIVKGQKNDPIAINSALGWLVLGKTAKAQKQHTITMLHTTMTGINAVLQKFWELEDIPHKPIFSKEDTLIEEHYVSTTNRQPDGRYVVRLPFVKEASMGESRPQAVRRFKSLEYRLEKDPEQKAAYSNVINEYLESGHLEQVPFGEEKSENAVYLPHHAVTREASTTTKVRVVFDGSAKTTNGKSLNDNLLNGPKQQDNLFNILVRFRTHKYGIAADISKMYRQIMLDERDYDYHRIVWRASVNSPLRDYRLKTVTFGIKSAPYLATRTLKQLADDEKEKYATAAIVLKRDFYVDDLLTGADTEKDARELVKQMTRLLMAGGFELRKWKTNSAEVFKDIPNELRDSKSISVTDGTEMTAALGLKWNPRKDCFGFNVNLIKRTRVLTKRVFLSEASNIFDPLGLISPVTVNSKILFQELWLANVSWDNTLPPHIAEKWDKLKNDMSAVNDISVPRFIGNGEIILCGFGDASEKAYAAAVYARTNEKGTITTTLVAGKNKVAPLKKKTLPQLELCGALTVSQLLQEVENSMPKKPKEIHAWTDSKTVLYWITKHPGKWKTFVANRVAAIQDIVPPSNWHHVQSSQNPADCASRGISPKELQSHSLWWTGPTFLLGNNFCEEKVEIPQTKEEERPAATHFALATWEIETSVIQKFSNLNRILRTLAKIKRWVQRARDNIKAKAGGTIIKETIFNDALTPLEIKAAWETAIKLTQAEAFEDEIRQLKKGQNSTKNKISMLNPFIDETGLLRVGGRLKAAPITIDQKHPVLLPKKHHLTTLIIRDAHHKNHHAGAQLLLATLQQRYWILGARDAVRSQIGKCILCTRLKAKITEQMMADLPAARVTPSRPFSKTGVDFAGPFKLKTILARGTRHYKAYAAIFVCFSTRAVHLEAVSGLTTQAFLAALERFSSTRGKPSDIYSDCGTNFVGADRQLTDFLQWTKETKGIADELATQGVHWHFNPPSAPHFGGLWEAGVKSMKYHLNRIVGNHTLNFEEFMTVLKKVEAILNSRPLCELSSDPTDYAPLTPGHFLIGDALNALPEPDLATIPVNRLTRWELTRQMTQHFWQRWCREYLTRLQQRPKWWKQQPTITKGQLVLLKDDLLHPLKWKLGRILEVHPGPDNRIRVVTIQTSAGTYTRPIGKICQLPLH